MRNIGKIFCTAAVALCCGSLPVGCTQDDIAPLGERHDVAVRLSVGTRIADETGKPSDVEAAIHTLRVYAFVSGRPAGHYFTDDVSTDPHTFFMDITFYTEGEQTVDFYAVANEGAMSLKRSATPGSTGLDYTLTAATTEEELKSVWFNDLLRTHLATRGLPMFCDKTSVKFDFTNVKQETPTAPGHEGHAWLNHPDIQLGLQRPVGKIGVFAAKAAGETGELHVTGLTMLANGIKVRNYLMPQLDETLRLVLSGGRDIPIVVAGGAVTAVLPATSDPTDPANDRSNPANYTSVMGENFYLYENPWSNGGSWDIPGDSRGAVLKVDYDFDGGETRTGYVYMPAIERNHYYAVCCLIHASGRIFVEYNVEEWTQEEVYDLLFQYPDYGNPILPADGTEPLENGNYPQPTVYHNSDPNDPAGSYTFQFNIRGPVNMPWCPVMFDATTDDFEIEAYQIDMATGQKVVKYRYGGSLIEPEINNCIPDPEDNPFYITVRALKSDNVGKTMSLGIAYVDKWLPNNDLSSGHSPLLLINGLTSDLVYENSTYAEFVVIKQVDIPSAAQTTDKQ